MCPQLKSKNEHKAPAHMQAGPCIPASGEGAPPNRELMPAPWIDQPQLPENFLGLIKELRPLALRPGLGRASHGPPHPWISTLEAAPWLTSLGL